MPHIELNRTMHTKDPKNCVREMVKKERKVALQNYNLMVKY